MKLKVECGWLPEHWALLSNYNGFFWKVDANGTREGGEQGGSQKITPAFCTHQALKSADSDQMIQGLHSSLAKSTAQFPVSLQWVPIHVGLAGNK